VAAPAWETVGQADDVSWARKRISDAGRTVRPSCGGASRIVAAEGSQEREDVLANHPVHVGGREALEPRPAKILAGPFLRVRALRNTRRSIGFLRRDDFVSSSMCRSASVEGRAGVAASTAHRVVQAGNADAGSRVSFDRGTPLDASQIRKFVNAMADKAEVRRRPRIVHVLRHTFASMLLRNFPRTGSPQIRRSLRVR
jgi:hypothetical protein